MSGAARRRLGRRQRSGADLWTVRVLVPPRREGADPLASAPPEIEPVETALAPFAEALSAFALPAAPGEPRPWLVEALSRTRPTPSAVRAALAPTGLGAAIKRLPERDWVAESERALPPVRAGRFFVHGSHWRGPLPGRCVSLRIDAGLAFGTGHHETTQACLAAIDGLLRRRRFRRPLDLGCGSGILAIALARALGVAVLAADNDPQAVEVARANATANGVGGLVRVVRSEGYRSPALRRSGPFDLVVANILADPLCRLAPALARHLTPKGVAVLSGFLRRQEAGLIAAHRVAGFAPRRRLHRGDWSVLVLERPDPSRARSRQAKRRSPEGGRREKTATVRSRRN